MKALLENLRAKIGELENAIRSENSIGFIFASKEILSLLSEIGKRLGMEAPDWLQKDTGQMLLDFSHPESAKGNHQTSTLSRSVNEFEWSVRVASTLKRLKIVYIGDLVRKTESQLMRQHNFGRISLLEVKRNLSRLGLRLGMQIPDWHRDNTVKHPKQLTGNNVEDPRNHLEKKHKSKTHSKELKINSQTFANLFQKIDELDLSFRSERVIKSLKTLYIGDLVRKTKDELLEIHSFGRKSLKEVQGKLDDMGLSLGMDIIGWPPDNMQKAQKRFASQLEQEKRRKAIEHRQNLESKIDNLEDELFFQLASLAGNNRNVKIVSKYFGLDGRGKKTLRAVGKEFSVTHERVRQIRDVFERRVKWRKGRKDVHTPILDSAIKSTLKLLPAKAEKIESELANRGISREPFRLEGLLSANELLGRKAPFCLVKLRQKRFALSPTAKNLPKLIIELARKSVEHWGVATVSDIAAQVADKTNQQADSRFTTIVISTIKDFHWLDDLNAWFWFSLVPRRNRLINLIKKVLSVSPRIDISELRSGTSRYHRMRGFAPPRRVLLELCRQLTWCKVEGNTIIADPPLDWEEVLDRSSTEWAMAAILKEYGPVMTRLKFQEKCFDLGMSQPAFFQGLIYSPIITKHAIGVYGLRGATVLPGTIKSLKPHRVPEKVLEDFGWTSDSKIWIGLRISQAMLESGVFTIPAGMKKFIKGSFSLKAADGAFINNLNVKNSSGWRLSTFFKRRGGEPGDYLVLTFDPKIREAKAYLGDSDILDEFKPHD